MTRLCFAGVASLAHEIGHIVLGHRTPYTNVKEREANYFCKPVTRTAHSHILCRM